MIQVVVIFSSMLFVSAPFTWRSLSGVNSRHTVRQLTGAYSVYAHYLQLKQKASPLVQFKFLAPNLPFSLLI